MKKFLTSTTFRIAILLVIGFALIMQPAFENGDFVGALRDARAILSASGFITVINALCYLTRKIRFAGIDFTQMFSKLDDNPMAASITFLAVMLFESATIIGAVLLAR